MAMQVGDQEALQAYGPFHRLVVGPNALPEIAQVAGEGVLSAHAPVLGGAPRVAAYRHGLPAKRQGIEFWTLSPPKQYGPRSYWTFDDPGQHLSVLVTRIDWGQTLEQAAHAMSDSAATATPEGFVPPVANPDPSLNDRFTYEAYVLAMSGAGGLVGDSLITAHHLPGALLGGAMGGMAGWVRLRRALRASEDGG